jgi:hypothetical protein
MRRNANRILIGKPAGKLPLETPRRLWKDGFEGDRKWMELAHIHVQW